MSTVYTPGPLTRLARRHGLVRSPLCRTTDRIEAAVTAVLAILAVLVVAPATIIAMGVYQRELSHAAATAAQETSVTAVLLTDAKLQATTSEPGVTPETIALARWQLPSGQQRSAPIWVGADRHAGDRVTIWIDRHGNRADPPHTPGLMVTNAVAFGVNLVLGGWAVLGMLWWTVCRVLSRINAARWDVQWARIGPQWSRRTWQ